MNVAMNELGLLKLEGKFYYSITFLFRSTQSRMKAISSVPERDF